MPKFDLKRTADRALTLQRLSSRYVRLMRLNNPVGIWLLMWPTLWALWLATDGKPTPAVFVVFVLGTIITRSAGCVINDFADRKIDPRVARTADRPLATGEVQPAEALILFVGLMLIAFGLVMTMNRLTVLLAVVGAALTIIYPFMKRVFATPQLVLGLAFAWGVPMAYAAETAQVSREGALLYICTIIWVVIYDTQYAMTDREDDLKIGVKSTAILFGEMDVAIIAGLQLTLLLGLLLLAKTAMLGFWFFVGLSSAVACGVRQLYLVRERDAHDCLRAFYNNFWFGGSIFAGILLNYVFATD
jgi:4-hydroxybenzoate polyprenyltransferase